LDFPAAIVAELLFFAEADVPPHLIELELLPFAPLDLFIELKDFAKITHQPYLAIRLHI
jgi:hypothetical protein